MFDRVKEFAGTWATILGFIGVIGSVAAYGTNLKNQFDASQTKIVQLETQVATLRDQLDKAYDSSTGTNERQGEKGERGEPGPQGPQGERGPAGPAGTISDEALDERIQTALRRELAKLPTSGSGTIQVSLGGSDVFESSECILLDQVRNLEILTLRKDLEFCENDGRLVARVASIRGDGYLAISTPGSGSSSCVLERKCTFGWLNGRDYIYERMGRDEKGIVSLFRLSR